MPRNRSTVEGGVRECSDEEEGGGRAWRLAVAMRVGAVSAAVGALRRLVVVVPVVVVVVEGCRRGTRRGWLSAKAPPCRERTGKEAGREGRYSVSGSRAASPWLTCHE